MYKGASLCGERSNVPEAGKMEQHRSTSRMSLWCMLPLGSMGMQ